MDITKPAPPCFTLSNELWLRVFSYLDRNDVDCCEHVCLRWHHLVRRNQRYLPGRVVEYVILCSKRCFSITICSGSLVKVFKFSKYFNTITILAPLNDPSHMTVETIRRTRRNRSLFKFAHVQQLYMNATGTSTSANDLLNAEEQSSSATTTTTPPTIPGLSFKVPPKSMQTRFKIKTPPVLFFRKLNLLFRNLRQINHFAFQRFSLTDGFVEKWLMNVEPLIAARNVCLHRVKRNFAKSACNNYLFGLLLTEHQSPRDKPEEADALDDDIMQIGV